MANRTKESRGKFGPPTGRLEHQAVSRRDGGHKKGCQNSSTLLNDPRFSDLVMQASQRGIDFSTIDLERFFSSFTPEQRQVLMRVFPVLLIFMVAGVAFSGCGVGTVDNPSHTPSPGSTSTPDATPSPAHSQIISVGSVITPISFSTQISTKLATAPPTNTSKPTEKPTDAITPSATVTPSSTPRLEESKRSQELPYNDFNKGQENDIERVDQKEFIERSIAYLKAEAKKAEKPDGVNSTLTTLVNPPLVINKDGHVVRFGSFGKYPENEPGLWQSPDDMEAYKHISDVFNKRQRFKDILSFNKHGLISLGVYGNADDRDASAAAMAAFLVARKKYPVNFMDYIVVDFINDPANVQAINNEMSVLFGQIQEEFLVVTEGELERRREQNQTDASSNLPETLQRSDQFRSCDVYMENGAQFVRGVTHIETEKITGFFNESNVEREGTLLVFTLDPNTEAKGIRSITFRSYTDEVSGYVRDVELDSASGEQELPCGSGKPVVPTSTKEARVDNQPTPPSQDGTPHLPTPAPTNIHIIPTATLGAPRPTDSP